MRKQPRHPADGLRGHTDSTSESIDELRDRTPSVLFFTDNGRGLGHLTRLLAVAKHAGGRFQPVFLTMSLGYPLLRDEGVPSEFFPAYHQLGLSKNDWIPLLSMRLAEAIDQFQARVVVVDHVIPPASFEQLRPNKSGVRFIWSRRGLWREGTNEAALNHSSAFDAVIEPGDLAAPIDVGVTTTHRDRVQATQPVILVQPGEFLTRDRAREALGLPPNGRAVLLNLSDASSEGLVALIEQSKETIYSVAGGEQIHLFAPAHPLHGEALTPVDGVILRSVFPVARYFKAFDGIVSTAGYNSFHEVMASGLPAIFVAHTSTNVDDQERRARFAELSGRAFWAPSVYSDEFVRSVELMLRTFEPSIAAATAQVLGRMTGAAQFADLIVEEIERARSESTSVSTHSYEDRQTIQSIQSKIGAGNSPRSIEHSSVVEVIVAVDHDTQELAELATELAALQRRDPDMTPVFLIGNASPQPLLKNDFPFESVMTPAEWSLVDPEVDYETYLQRRIEALTGRYGANRTPEVRPGMKVAARLTIRSFRLLLPTINSDLRRSLDVSLPSNFYVPRLLEENGLAGYEAASLACWLAVLSLPDPGAAFDVGANVGPYAWLAAALSGRTTVAFEPVPELLDAMATVGERNNLEIVSEDIALADHDGFATLYLSDHTDSSNSLVAGFRRSSKSIEVVVRKLDTYVDEKATIPHVLKIDTETNEPEVLAGALRTLAEHRPWLIVEVLAGRTEARLMEVLEPFDYSWYPISNEMPLVRSTEIIGDPTHQHMNWLIAPSPPQSDFWASMEDWMVALEMCKPDTG